MNFLTAVFALYLLLILTFWWLGGNKFSWIFLPLANLVFYSYWYPPAAIPLLMFAIAIYWLARRIEASQTNAKRWLVLALIISLSPLAYFKYFGFFASQFTQNRTSTIILPLGISFFTFRGMSYLIDVYRKKFAAVRSPLQFFAFLSFFPQLPAGPIVRPGEFFPQLARLTTNQFEDWEFAIYRILRGLFLKVIISDHIVTSVNSIFASEPANLGSITAWMGALFFSAQIFCDFAGYSDIAIGISRLFGLKTPENFDSPYLATTLGDFWRRWHITLSSWFRDYVYFPIARSARLTNWLKLLKAYANEVQAVISILVMFTLSGLWHGANWTFIAWGLLHGTGIVIERRTGIYALQQGDTPRNRALRWIWRLVTLALIIFLWVMFRAPSIEAGLQYWQAMVSGPVGLSLNATMINGVFWLAIFAVHQVILYGKRPSASLKSRKLERLESYFYFAAILFIASTPTDFIYLSF